MVACSLNGWQTIQQYTFDYVAFTKSIFYLCPSGKKFANEHKFGHFSIFRVTNCCVVLLTFLISRHFK